MGNWGRWENFERAKPRAVKGGIKAQTKRGAFGQSWWAKRWIAVLESFDIGARLSRGRSYARRGQVSHVEITNGLVNGKVQGSSSRPYSVSIKVVALSEADWTKVTAALCLEALFAAKLLAGEMPQEIEQIFVETGLSLFPVKSKDLATSCSCPDWSNPCKHIAAVYYLLGEEFDRDPFLIFRLRGMNREALIERLGAVDGVSEDSEVASCEHSQAKSEELHEPIEANAVSYWRNQELPADFFGEVIAPPVTAAMPRRLGSFPFWRGTEPFLDTLEPIYARASSRGLEIITGS